MAVSTIPAGNTIAVGEITNGSSVDYVLPRGTFLIVSDHPYYAGGGAYAVTTGYDGSTNYTVIKGSPNLVVTRTGRYGIRLSVPAGKTNQFISIIGVDGSQGGGKYNKLPPRYLAQVAA